MPRARDPGARAGDAGFQRGGERERLERRARRVGAEDRLVHDLGGGRPRQRGAAHGRAADHGVRVEGRRRCERPHVAGGRIDDRRGAVVVEGETLFGGALEAGAQRDRHLGARDHLGVQDRDRGPACGHRAERPAGRAAQQVLGAVLEAGAADHVARQVALRSKPGEVVGGDRADVADRLAGEPLLRVAAHAVDLRGPYGPIGADDSPAGRDLAIKSQRAAVAELGEDEPGVPSDLPAVSTLRQVGGPSEAHDVEPIAVEAQPQRHLPAPAPGRRARSWCRRPGSGHWLSGRRRPAQATSCGRRQVGRSRPGRERGRDRRAGRHLRARDPHEVGHRLIEGGERRLGIGEPVGGRQEGIHRRIVGIGPGAQEGVDHGPPRCWARGRRGRRVRRGLRAGRPAGDQEEDDGQEPERGATVRGVATPSAAHRASITRRNPSAARVPGALTELLGRPSHPALGLVEVAELALVQRSARTLRSSVVADVDELVRLVRAPQEQLGDLPRLEPGAGARGS